MSGARSAIQAEYQWVTAIRVQDTIGAAPWAPKIVEHLEGFGRPISTLDVAWSLLSNVFLMIYARKRTIPLERIVDDPQKLKDMLERGDGKPSASAESTPTA